MQRIFIVLAVSAACACASDRERSRSFSLQDLAQPAVDELAAEQSASFQHEGPALSTAATPLGWEAESERRAQEEAFARGEPSDVTPPNAIGGGPVGFER